jgi:hypothetical protein
LFYILIEILYVPTDYNNILIQVVQEIQASAVGGRCKIWVNLLPSKFYNVKEAVKDNTKIYGNIQRAY